MTLSDVKAGCVDSFCFIKSNTLRLLNRVAFELIRYIGLRNTWHNPPSIKTHQRIFPLATYSPWLSDFEFLSTYKQVKKYTLVDIYRCYELWMLTKQVAHVSGDILEVGVWKGGSGAIIAKAASAINDKKVFLADTFAGVVKATGNDTRYKGGEHADTSAYRVKNLLESLSLKNVEILEGVFPDDTHVNVHGNISMLHCDVDVYKSAKDIVEWCLPRLSIGSILVFDDFGFSGCEGVTSYCEELKKMSLFHFIHNLNGHAIFIKIAN